MYKWLFVFGFVGITAQSLAEIKEKPIKLENQGNNSSDQIYFPPATEPYKPVATAPAAVGSSPVQGPKEIPKTYVSETRSVPQMEPQQISTPAPFSNIPVSNYTPGMPIGREAIEQASRTCEAQLTEMWQRKSIQDPVRRAKFQKSMGEAKYRCDQLKESAKLFQQADAHLNTFHFNLQQAQEAAN